MAAPLSGGAFEAELLALEQRILAASAGGWLANIDRIRALLAVEDPAVVDALLVLAAPTVEDAALAGLLEAYVFGADSAQAIIELGHLSADMLAQVEAAMPHPGAGLEVVPPTILDRIRGLDAELADAVTRSSQLALAGEDPALAAAPVLGVAVKMKAAIETGVNASANSAITDVTAASDLPLVWVAERDACVICLAYAGLVVAAGDSFPGGLTYGAKVYDSFRRTVEHPPRHPSCRCHLEPLLAQAYADALQREAQRSILRGYSLTSESMRVRIDAAQRLAASGPDLPKSVIDFAQAAVKRGTFKTRAVPIGGKAAA